MTGRRKPIVVRGFTLIEMLIATLVTMAVMGVTLALASGAQATFQAQGEVADLHQRLRAAVDLLAAELRAAEGVRPYRVGGARYDASLGVYYRPDTISVLGVPSSPLSADAGATRTYYLKSDPGSDTFELMQFDGQVTDLPVAEHVVRLAFEYLADPAAVGAAPVVVEPAILVDGPWVEDAARRLYDADLDRVREVRVHLRVESAEASLRGRAGRLFVRGGTSNRPERFVPDEEAVLHVALRGARR